MMKMKMKQQKNGVQFVLTASLLVVAVVTAIGFYASRPQTTAGAYVREQFPYLGRPSNTPTPQPDNEILSQTVNDITVKITSAKIIETGVEIGICFTTLDGGEWYPMPGHLFYSSYEIYPDEFEFTTETLADGKNFGERCALVRYRIDDKENITTPIQFSIIAMHAPQREMYTPCQEFQQRLETNPNAHAYGLRARCVETGNNGISVELIGNAKSVSQEKAKGLLNLIASANVDGPWEFTITKIEK
ncbi:MAG: hypothetical protein HYZ24_14700 [Chloroflexi bacterium]|nr:hypothetical protein [Chloroflexota bacterium]